MIHPESRKLPPFDTMSDEEALAAHNALRHRAHHRHQKARAAVEARRMGRAAHPSKDVIDTTGEPVSENGEP